MNKAAREHLMSAVSAVWGRRYVCTSLGDATHKAVFRRVSVVGEMRAIPGRSGRRRGIRRHRSVL